MSKVVGRKKEPPPEDDVVADAEELASTHLTSAKQYLASRGIPLPRQPRFREELRLPKRLDALSTSEITELMNKYAKMQAYVETVLVEAEIAHRQVDDQKNKTEALIFLKLKDDNREATASSLKLLVDTHSRVLTLRESEAILAAKKKLLGTVAKSLKDAGFLLSRDLTRRTSVASRALND